MALRPFFAAAVVLILLAGCAGDPRASGGLVEFYFQMTNGTPREQAIQVLLTSEGGRQTVIQDTFHMQPNSKTTLTSYNATTGEIRVRAEIATRNVEERMELRPVDPATHRGQGLYIHVREDRLWIDLVQFPNEPTHMSPDERGAPSI